MLYKAQTRPPVLGFEIPKPLVSPPMHAWTLKPSVFGSSYFLGFRKQSYKPTELLRNLFGVTPGEKQSD